MKYGLFILLLVVIVVRGFAVLIYPSFHMDESYYIGAAIRVLEGDLFLTTYKFDKPFLNALWYIPGILIAGDNALGFRLSALIATGFGLWWLSKIFLCIFEKQTSRSHYWSLVFAFLFYQSPLVNSYTLSAFAEPYLLALLFGALYYWSHQKDKRISYMFFSAAFFTKFTGLLWAPIYLFSIDWRRPLVGLSKETQYLLKAAWPIFILGLFYTLTNAKKFGFLSMVKQNTIDNAGRISTWQALSFWSEKTFYAVSDVPLVSCVIVCMFFLGLVGCVQDLRAGKWKLSSISSGNFYLRLILPPLVCILIVYLLLNVSLYNRYVLLFFPFVFFMAFRGVEFLTTLFRSKSSMVLRSRLFELQLLIIAFVLSLNLLEGVRVAEKQPAENGRLLSSLSHELKNGPVHNPGLAWDFAPYFASHFKTKSCVSTECLMAERLGVGLLGEQMIVRFGSQPGRVVEIEKIPYKFGVNDSCQLTSEIVPMSTVTVDKIAQTFLRKIRLKKYKTHKLKYESSADYEAIFDGVYNWNSDLQDISITVDLKTEKIPKLILNRLNDRVAIHFTGKLVVTASDFANRSEVYSKLFIGLRLNEIRIDGLQANLVDLAPVIYKSYLVPIMPLNEAIEDAKNIDGVFIKDDILQYIKTVQKTGGRGCTPS